MKFRKSNAVAIAVVAVAFTGLANAQTATPQAAHKTHATPASKPSGSDAAAQVETWTRKQWDSAQKEWAKDKTKWSDCQKQSGDKHLDGRKSWSFLYTCMTN